ncbi:PAS domain S-box protein [Skermanella mucosa]|uniref:ATP-binding protein n=1 Tax=Skermanella mucosa TaxID=1789672 RepID=UPI00192BA418|nr:ATP-binding protein [Skermanella mucosa]UEM22499.1 PAS domain S-box protein [Skermanella mucosa]
MADTIAGKTTPGCWSSGRRDGADRTDDGREECGREDVRSSEFFPPEAFEVLDRAPVPILLAGPPADARSGGLVGRMPVIHANPALARLAGRAGVEIPPGCRLDALFRLAPGVPDFPAEDGAVAADLAGASATEPAGQLLLAVVTDRLGKRNHRLAAFIDGAAPPDHRATVEALMAAASLALASAMEAATARSTLNTVLSSLTDAFMSVDHAWRFTRVNRMAAEACGMAPEDMIGRSFWELFPEAVGSPLQAAAHRAETEQVPVHAEAFHPRLGRWFEYHVYPSPDGLGIIETDITSRKQQEARQRLMADLNEAVRLLVDPTEMMEVALVLAGRHFGVSRMVYAEIDPGRLTVTGLRQYRDGVREVPGDIRLADFGARALETLQRGHTLVVDDVRSDARTAEGIPAFERIDARAMLVVPLTRSARLLALLSLQERVPRQWTMDEIDLAERVAELIGEAVERARAERAVRDGERRLRLATQAAALGEFEYDPATGSMIRSVLVDRLFGFQPGEVGSHIDPFFGRIHPDDIEAFRRGLEDAIAGRADWNHIFRVVHREGRICWIASVGEVIRRTDGTAQRMVGIIRDITVDWLAEQELRRARDAATEASAAKTRFLAAVSHDLRQPIQAVSLFLDLLNHKILPPDARDLIGMIDVSVKGLQGMLNGLLDAARLDAGIVKPVIQPFNLDELLERLAAEFEGQTTAARLLFEVRPAKVAVSSDPVLLEQILRNLLSNAVKFTMRGCILLECIPNETTVDIHVADTGPGIPEDKTEAIFQDFLQLDNPARDRSRGIGLGLGTVARTARLLGHPVGVRSKVGEGAIFTVTVPIADAPVKPPEKLWRGHEQWQDRILAERSILVVDDDHAVLTALVMLLEDWGMRVIRAGGLDEVAELLPELDSPLDLVLTDYRLPNGATGAEVIDLVRQSGHHAEIAGLVMTGDTSPERLIEAQKAQCRLLHKPVNPDDLKRALIACF